jgi:hypothetical protein
MSPRRGGDCRSPCSPHRVQAQPSGCLPWIAGGLDQLDDSFLELRRVEPAYLAISHHFHETLSLDADRFAKAGNLDYSAFHDDSSLFVIFSSFSISGL